MNYERMFMASVAVLAEITQALNIPPEVASASNGSAEMLAAIRKLQLGLDNCRLLAMRNAHKQRGSDWEHIIRFCTEAGRGPSPLRAEKETGTARLMSQPDAAGYVTFKTRKARCPHGVSELNHCNTCD